ncbi:MAG: ABC transporter permease [Candidatus Portnoybacteria bacterium]
MKISSILKQSIIALRANKLRSIFSILGIVIGVSAVVIILSLGQGLKGLVTNEVESFGSDILAINVKIPGAGQVGTLFSVAQGIKITTLKLRDVQDLQNKENFPYIKAVTGQVFGQEWVSYGKEDRKVLLYGGSPDFLEIFRTLEVEKGRYLNKGEDDSLAKVAVLGSNLKEKLFGQSDSLGEKIKLKGLSFKVIGVFEPYGGMSFGGIDINDFMYIPLQTALKEVLGIDYLSEIDVVVQDESYFSRAISDISRLLRKNHNIKDPSKDDFQITTMTEVIEQVNEISVILNLLLGFLAAISLLVGGIGIMNIMLVSVSERTKEIGLRKALGATNRSVLYQFLIEALVITILGGIIGVIIGISNSLVASVVIRTQGLPGWPITISGLAIVVALFVSMAIGLIFGIYPARKASQLNPIDALRKE